MRNSKKGWILYQVGFACLGALTAITLSSILARNAKSDAKKEQKQS